jgi:hypothetical protein
MNNLLISLIVVLLLGASFFAGYSMKKTSYEASWDCTNQIDSCWSDWSNAVNTIYSGEVESIFTSHEGDLDLLLKDGSWERGIKIPPYVNINDILSRCGDKCKDISVASE